MLAVDFIKNKYFECRLIIVLYRFNRMIQFRHRNTTQRIPNYSTGLHKSSIKPTDAKPNEILVNGFCLPGYERLSRQNRKKKQSNSQIATSLQRSKQKQQKEQATELFKNSAIRTRLKSVQLQIKVSSAKPSDLQRKQSLQKDIVAPLEQFIKTNSIMCAKPNSERYIGAFTALNWTNRKLKTNQYNTIHASQCQSTTNKLENVGFIRPTLATTTKGIHSQNFNDCLLTQCKRYLSLRKSQGKKGTQLKLSSFCQKDSQYNPSLSEFGYQQTPRSKVCYSIKMKKGQTKTTDLSHIASAKLPTQCLEGEI